MNKKEKALFEKAKKLIDDKRIEIIKYANENNSSHLELVKKDIFQLRKYIKGCILLKEQDIDNLLSNLVQYRISLSIPINNAKFARTRIMTNSKEYPKYDDVSVLSYTPLHLQNKVSQGRFNKKEQRMYYGSIFYDYSNLNVPFSEIGLKEVADYVNTLISEVTQDINLRIIGLFSFIENKYPLIDFHPILKEISDYYEKTHEEKLLKAIKMVDDFFVEITTSKGNERVYNVTSILGNIYLEDKSIDGILYQYVKSDEVPNVVLKASSVDTKVKHFEAKIALLTEEKDGEYIIKELNKGKIDNCKIIWKK